MKYQQLENLECGWKLNYLLKKYKEGEAITRYIDTSEVAEAINELQSIQTRPTLVEKWIEDHFNPHLDSKLKQTIRARRKRHFNAEKQHTRKKSIDLDFFVWQRLSDLAKQNDCTLSEIIIQLINSAGNETINN